MNRARMLALAAAVAAATLRPGAAPADVCGDLDRPPCDSPESGEVVCCKEVELIGAVDPNEKVGLPGYGPARWIADQAFLPYTIYFENLATATAAAQEVTITDALDPTVVDLATFSLAAFGFGERVLPLPPGVAAWSSDVDLRPGLDLIVRFEAFLDAGTGSLSFRFRSLDPGTLAPTEDPEIGFLPPDVRPPEGQGFVSFSVRARPALPTGTTIANRSSIVFDRNAPIETPLWVNTVDADPPASAVDPLPPVQGYRSFPVSWSGADVGSGVRDYSVYVSEDGGAYAPWLVTTAAVTDTFLGEHGRAYRFYSLVRDSVGNLEAVPAAADAETVIDTTTAALVSLVDATVRDGRVIVRWKAASGLGRAWVERRTPETRWQRLGEPVARAHGLLEFADSTVVVGRRYGYRLALAGPDGEEAHGEVWIEVRPGAEFALAGTRPHPASGRLVVEFSLPEDAPALLELFDVAGRRLAARDVGGLGAGAHVYALGDGLSLRGGFYVLRLTQGERAASRKVVVRQ